MTPMSSPGGSRPSVTRLWHVLHGREGSGGDGGEVRRVRANWACQNAHLTKTERHVVLRDRCQQLRASELNGMAPLLDNQSIGRGLGLGPSHSLTQMPYMCFIVASSLDKDLVQLVTASQN